MSVVHSRLRRVCTIVRTVLYKRSGGSFDRRLFAVLPSPSHHIMISQHPATNNNHYGPLSSIQEALIQSTKVATSFGFFATIPVAYLNGLMSPHCRWWLPGKAASRATRNRRMVLTTTMITFVLIVVIVRRAAAAFTTRNNNVVISSPRRRHQSIIGITSIHNNNNMGGIVWPSRSSSTTRQGNGDRQPSEKQILVLIILALMAPDFLSKKYPTGHRPWR